VEEPSCVPVAMISSSQDSELSSLAISSRFSSPVWSLRIDEVGEKEEDLVDGMHLSSNITSLLMSRPYMFHYNQP
jgi:hypothetical protein